MKTRRRLKVLTIVSYTYPYIGSGIGNVALSQSEHLAKLKHQVTLVSSNFPKTRKEFTHNKVRHIKLSALGFLERLNIPVPLFIFNKAVLRKFKEADIIHIHDFYYPSSLLGLLFGKFYKKPVVVTVHVTHIKYDSPLINLAERLVLNLIGKLILNSSDRIILIEKSLIKSSIFSMYQKKVIHLPNGVDLNFYHSVSKKVKNELRLKHSLAKSKKIVLFVGRFVPKKGFNLLLKINPENFLLVCIGDSKSIPINNISKSVLILGQKDKRELKEYYQLSDVFILPSYGEGFPLSVQEAMACGLPIMVGKNNGYLSSMNKKYIEKLKYNSSSIKKSTLMILKSSKRLKEMSNYSKRYSKQYLSWNKNAKDLEKIYQDLKNTNI